MHLGDHLRAADIAHLDKAKFPRLWEVSIRGATAPETRGLPVALEEHFGGVRVRRYDRPPGTTAEVLWDLGPILGLNEVDFAPRMCTIIPVRAGAPSLDLGEKELGRSLVVGAGLTDFRSRKENYSRARLEVRVDGVAGASGLVGNEGWVVLHAATRPGRGAVSLVASVDPTFGPARASTLDLCVAVEARR
jgi:hypothetical protein